tara:strand:+ start:4527 stop:8333 length:3807 start_codon:yes stop_codon:yes gene_type:complete
MHDSFKLITFNVYDEIPESQGKFFKNGGGVREFMVQMFGINEKGETASIYVEGYSPFFYIKVPDNWSEKNCVGLRSQLSSEMGEYYEDSIVSTKLLKRKTLYGFDGGKLHTFVLIKFKNEMSMKKAKRLWYTTNKDKEYILDPDGYEFGPDKTYLYEAHIPPLLRMFHIKEISPSGWIALPKKHTLKHVGEKSTTCKYEYTINYKNILALNNKEAPVPYKICSFDIEASSSHGDFPLAKKNYKKLAENIADIWGEKDEYDCTDPEFIENIIFTAFQTPGYSIEGIQAVYTKYEVTDARIETLINRWINAKPAENKNLVDDIDSDTENMSDESGDEGEEGINEDGAEEVGFKKKKFKPKAYTKKNATMIDLLNDTSVSRDTLIVELTKSLTRIFPTLKGDEVTFIGSTFLLNGEDKPYLNHCIVKGSCVAPDVEKCRIESYKREKNVLLAWTKLIQKEDPDIIIGYNIMGFDWQFMYQRAEELDIVKEFLKLSRNKNEICLSRKWNHLKKCEEEGMETNTIFIASGQHDLKYIKMNGRLQIDLYNYLRRDYNLIKYKLDYVSGYFIGDKVKKIEHEDGNTKIYSKNLTGLEPGTYITFEEEAHSADMYKGGEKFIVYNIDPKTGTFWINGIETPDMNKKVKWGLAKDDVTPQDIFRMTNEGPNARATIAKYCIQDCNLVHHLMRKIDVMTGYTEMASLCSIPMDFLVFRGQGIKLTSYIGKKCREKGTLMPTLQKGSSNEGYEGAIVLPPKSDLYLDDPVACVDYSSLYPSCMISENISHDSKVWTMEYDLDDNLLKETGEKNSEGKYIYDNMTGYKYVDVVYDTYKWQHKNNNPKSAMEKVKVGYKICRFAQFPEGKGIMPSILEELLAERKRVRKLIPNQQDEFMKNVLDKRQLSIKVTANSMYGQTGAKTSTFYEIDCAASTTATGRKLLTYAERVIEEGYKNKEIYIPKEEDNDGNDGNDGNNGNNMEKIIINAERVYGDTDSVFFKFNPREMDGTPIKGLRALKLTINLAKEVGEVASKFLKKPHDLEYEKTFWPFALLSKKRYVGMLFEEDPYKCVRKSMGIVLKRRDNAPIVKDVYGGVIDILMKDKDVEKAATFLRSNINDLMSGNISMDKLVITKSLRSGYKNPKQIAHNVLANRIGKRDPGNKPSVGDRVAYVYIENSDKKALQGDRIETPEYIIENNIPINYKFYVTNQIMKPIQQVFALVLEDLNGFKEKKGLTLHKWKKELALLKDKFPDENQYCKKVENLRNKEVNALLFDEFIK